MKRSPGPIFFLRKKWSTGAPTPVGPAPTLLLHFDTDFNDIGPNDYPVTVQGDPTIDTSVKKFGAGSCYMGSESWFEIYDNTLSNIPTGPFGIDFWFSSTSTVAYSGLVSKAYQSGNFANGAWLLAMTGSGQIQLYLSDFSTSAPALSSSSSGFNDGNFHHCAWTRDENNVHYLFVDGNLVAQATISVQIKAVSGTPFVIGNDDSFSGRQYIGRLDEFRVLYGTCPWDAAFSPPTQPYYWPGPTPRKPDLLLHFSSDFTDSGRFGYTVTEEGSPEIDTSFFKFAPGSAKFDGGNWLEISNDGIAQIPPGPFGIDFWFATTTTEVQATFLNRPNNAFYAGAWFFGINQAAGDGKILIFTADYNVTTPELLTSDASFNDGAFHHCAWTRDATNTHRLFIDGKLEDSIQSNFSFTPLPGTPLYIAQDGYFPGRAYSGNLDEIRFVYGECPWTEDFTPPTAPY